MVKTLEAQCLMLSAFFYSVCEARESVEKEHDLLQSLLVGSEILSKVVSGALKHVPEN